MRISTSDLMASGGGDEVARRWPDGLEVTAETVREAVGMRVPLEWLARDLMRPVARRAYREAIVPARSAYREATDQARRAYREATDQARRAYREAIVPARSAYREATDQARRAYYEEIAPALRAYREAVEQAEREYDEARIQAFIEASRIHDQEVAG